MSAYCSSDFGVRAGDLELAQRRQIHNDRPLAAGPVFRDRPFVAEPGRQPIAAIFGEAARQRGEARVKRGLARELGLGIGCHSIGHRSGEALLVGIGAHMDVGGVPSIGRIDVVRAGRGHADDISQRAQKHIVARPRPRLIEIEHVVGVDAGVVKEVERHPALARGDAVGRELRVEIVRAVDVSGIALVVVIARVTGEPEGIVASDRVAHHLHQRLHLLIEGFGEQAGKRIALPHQRARRGDIERMLNSLVELARGKALEIGALAPGNVDDLDEFAGAHDIGLGGRLVDADILQRIGERLGQRRLVRHAQAAAPDVDADRRRRILRAGLHGLAGRGHDQQAIARDGEFARIAGAGFAAEQRDGAGAGEIDAAPLEPGADGTRAIAICAQNLLQAARIAIAAGAQNGRIDGAGASAATSSQRCMPSTSTTRTRSPAWIGTAMAPPPGTV